MYNPAPRATNSFDLVVFDDDVLVDSEPHTNEVYTQMLRVYGYELNTEEYLREYWGKAMTHRLEVT